MEIFPETLVAQNLPFQDAGLPLPQDTYRTGVLEILSEGSRFGLPSYRLAPLRKWFLSLSRQHKEMIHGSVLPKGEYKDG